MSETENELWGVIDQEIFGTDDPEKIKARFLQAYEKREAQQSTFGGYLRCLREDDYATTAEIAFQAGIPRSVWQSWEANRTVPTQEELAKVCHNLELGERTIERLSELRRKLPRTILTRLSRHEPDQLVACGRGVEETQLMWDTLHPILKELLILWAEAHNRKFPEELSEVLFELKTPEEQDAWVFEVLGESDVE